MIRSIYLLQVRDKYMDHLPSYEVAFTMVVVADTPRAARKLASESAGDEGPNPWLNASQVSCGAIGVAGIKQQPRVVCKEDNAS